MDTEIVFMVKESSEGGYEAQALGQSIFTEADSIEELRAMVMDAVAVHFDDNESISAKLVDAVTGKEF